MVTSHTKIAGYVAVSCFFLFTVVGACAQVNKLINRTHAWRRGELERHEVCAGLHPVRELWSYSAFLLFALSGLTRSYIDYFLVLSRLPIVILSTIILWFLQFHDPKGAKKYFVVALAGDLILLCMIAAVIGGFHANGSVITLAVDSALSVVSILLFYGKQLQAFTMYCERRSKAVSWLREMGLVIKDLTGLWYALTVGSELLWVALTHILSAVSSTTICIVKFVIEQIRPMSLRETE